MAAQKCKKKSFTEIFRTFECLIKVLKSLDSSRSYGRPLEKKKGGTSRDLFLPESDFKSSSAVNFPKTSRLWRPGNQP